ncbi:MAG: hypothetical protein IPK52_22435 [Chloroflexi bacterium]|nr:hypothetical protein [Chloroflexota bacterium]
MRRPTPIHSAASLIPLYLTALVSLPLPPFMLGGIAASRAHIGDAATKAIGPPTGGPAATRPFRAVRRGLICLHPQRRTAGIGQLHPGAA